MSGRSSGRRWALRSGRPGRALALAAVGALLVSCSASAIADTGSDPSTAATTASTTAPAPTVASSTAPAPTADPPPDPSTGAAGRDYPWHTDIVATTFWVGEIFDPTASDGSQVLSTYDADWLAHYGGCDGVAVDHDCRTERRTADNDWFPTAMTPLENPFYLDLPFDDVNDPSAFARRGAVIPWALDPPYRDLLAAGDVSLMKNRWVQMRKGDRTCYAQIQDAGPGQYDDAEYVFGSDDRRPANGNFNGAGMDVSPAVNGCLGFADLNGENDRVDWRFVDDADVPPGPWRNLVTTSGVSF